MSVSLSMFFLILIAGLLMAWALNLQGAEIVRRPGYVLAFMLIIGSALSAYWYWGSWPQWQQFKQQQASQAKARAMLSRYNNADELINEFKQKLTANPQSAKGWFLLGRLYASQQQWQAAHDAFSQSLQLEPENEKTRLSDIEALWQLNQQQFTPEVRTRLQQIQNANPKQPDALAMLAWDAYTKKQYDKAIDYWQQILIQLPSDSEEARTLRKAIARAQQAVLHP